jgi:hypothetical protein
MAALRIAGLGALVQAYLDAYPVESLFFSVEAQAFLSYLSQHADLDPCTRAVVCFEAAFLRQREAKPTDPDPRCELVTFPAPVERVLDAVLAGRPLPPPDGRTYDLLFDPRSEAGWELMVSLAPDAN